MPDNEAPASNAGMKRPYGEKPKSRTLTMTDEEWQRFTLVSQRAGRTRTAQLNFMVNQELHGAGVSS